MTCIVTHRQMREIGYCNRGARLWFERHGLDWPAFLKDGLPAEKLEETGDAMALRLVKHARGVEHGE